MKKTVIIIALLLLTLPVLAANSLRLTATADFLSVQDSGFKSLYGSSAVMPELAISLKVVKDFRLRLAGSTFKKTGTVEGPFEDTCESTQTFVYLAPEWEHKLNKRLALAIHAGGMYVSYKETAFDESVSDNAIGFDAGAGLYVGFGSRLLGCLTIGYCQASDTVNDVDIKLGGFKAGIGLGIRL
jgi:hypothetical protein